MSASRETIQSIIATQDLNTISLLFTRNSDFIERHLTEDDETPLLYAARVRPKAVSLLLEKGANPNAQRKDGRTALHILAANKDKDYITPNMQAFMDAGANFTLKDNDGHSILKVMLQETRRIDVSSIISLLKLTDDRDAIDPYNNTVLHYAAKAAVSLQTRMHLLNNLAAENVSSLPTFTLLDDKGKTFFHYLLNINCLPASIVNLLPEEMILETQSSDGKTLIDKLNSVTGELSPKVIDILTKQDKTFVENGKAQKLVNFLQDEIKEYFQNIFNEKSKANPNPDNATVQKLLEETFTESWKYLQKRSWIIKNLGDLTQNTLAIKQFVINNFLSECKKNKKNSYGYLLLMALINLRDYPNIYYIFASSTFSLMNKIFSNNKDKIFDTIIACPDEELRKKLLEEALNISTYLAAFIRTKRSSFSTRDTRGNLQKVIEAYRKYFSTQEFEQALVKAKSKPTKDFEAPLLKTFTTLVAAGQVREIESFLSELLPSERVAYLTHNLIFKNEKEPCNALHYAASHRHELISVFLKFGAPVDEMDHEKNTALHRLLASKDPTKDQSDAKFSAEIKSDCELLLGYGANPNIINADGRCAFKLGIDLSVLTYEVVEAMLKAHASAKITDRNGNNLLHMLFHEVTKSTIIKKHLASYIKYGVPVNQPNNLGQTPLAALLERNTFPSDAIYELLAHGADINTTNSKGKTILHCLLTHKGSNKKEVVNTHLPKLLKFNPDVKMQDNENETALSIYLKSDDVDFGLCDLLLDAGASIFTVDEDANTLLHRLFMANLGEAIILKHLEKYLSWLSPHQPNAQGQTALHFIFENPRYLTVNIVQTLLKHPDTNPNIQDKDYNTFLHLISKIKGTQSEKSELIDFLLRKGANPNLPNNELLTPYQVLNKRMMHYARDRFKQLSKQNNYDQFANIIQTINDTYHFINNNSLLLSKLKTQGLPNLDLHKLKTEIMENFVRDNYTPDFLINLLNALLISKRFDLFFICIKLNYFDKEKFCSNYLFYKDQITDELILIPDVNERKIMLEKALDPTTTLGQYMRKARLFSDTDLAKGNLEKITKAYRLLFTTEKEYKVALDAVVSGRYKITPQPPTDPYPHPPQVPSEPPPYYVAHICPASEVVSPDAPPYSSVEEPTYSLPYYEAPQEIDKPKWMTEPVKVEHKSIDTSYTLFNRFKDTIPQNQTPVEDVLKALSNFIKNEEVKNQKTSPDANQDLITFENNASAESIPENKEILSDKKIVDEKTEDIKSQESVQAPVYSNAYAELRKLPSLASLNLTKFSPEPKRKQIETSEEPQQKIALTN